MKAVITVIGEDNVGILHKVSGICAEYHANVIEVTQSVLQNMFAMIMMVDISTIIWQNWEKNLVYLFIRCMKISLNPCIVFND